jgi:hypothetical protein
VVSVEDGSTPNWRRWFLSRLDATLIMFELVLSAIFISLSYLTGSLYLKGIGVGLIIAWVTSAIAHLFKRSAG